MPVGVCRRASRRVHCVVLPAEHWPHAPDACRPASRRRTRCRPRTRGTGGSRHYTPAACRRALGVATCSWTHVPSRALQSGRRARAAASCLSRSTRRMRRPADRPASRRRSPCRRAPRHACVVASHTGVGPPHWASPGTRTQVPAAVAHRRRARALRGVGRRALAARARRLAGRRGAAAVAVARAGAARVRRASHTGVVPPQWVSAGKARTSRSACSRPASRPRTRGVRRRALAARAGRLAGRHERRRIAVARAGPAGVGRVLHAGVMPPHCAFDVHGTQVAVGTSHTGSRPSTAVAFVAEQCPHAPLG